MLAIFFFHQHDGSIIFLLCVEREAQQIYTLAAMLNLPF